jgi:hypothetical protein
MTEIPSFLASSAGFCWLPEPRKTWSPKQHFQNRVVGLEGDLRTPRASAHLATMSFAQLGFPREDAPFRQI